MQVLKSISKVIPSSAIRMGNLLTRQPLPASSMDYLDPFLLLHHTGPFTFLPGNAGLPFAPHPHKGFETVTFIFDGAVEHRDSTCMESVIRKGGIQWMTAGRGIVHSENLPVEMKRNGGEVEYIQLWINLPAKFKKLPPLYQGIQANQIPVVSIGVRGSKSYVYAGDAYGKRGPANSVTGVHARVYDLEKDDVHNISIADDKEVLLYVMDGVFDICGTLVKAHHMPVFSAAGNDICVKVIEKGRFLWCTGDRIQEPMVSHGPFVMNSETEILEAMRDYQQGKMGILFD